MADSIRPALARHGGKIAWGSVVASAIAAVTIYLLNQVSDTNTKERPNYEARRQQIEKVAELQATDARHDLHINYIQKDVIEIKEDNKEIKRGNREILNAVNALQREVGVLNARLDFNR